MDYVVAVVLGILQGLTEWLPVSSSGHLVIGQRFFGTKNPVAFDAVLHLGTMTSVVIFMRKRIVSLFRATLGALMGQTSFDEDPDARFGMYIILATFPIVILSLLLEPYVVGSFRSLPTVAMALVVTGGVLLFTAHVKGEDKELTERSALTVGLAQAVALFPGISRSGMTISAGIYSGITRERAAEFAFILAVPAILGAGVLQMYRAMNGDATIDPGPAAAGFLAAIVVGYMTLKTLYRIVIADRFHLFAYYCFALSAALWCVILFL
jgi:undecaprenyl-diphosphatase